MEEKNEYYVIYCTNNYHNIYMDYRGETVEFKHATVFNDLCEAHKFLREKQEVRGSYYHWSVVNVNDLEDYQKEWVK